jgi:hypothetical protein
VPWQLGQIFKDLLDRKLNPNQTKILTGESALIYAIKNLKIRAFRTLLNQEGTDLSRKDSIGQTILGTVNLMKARGNETKVDFDILIEEIFLQIEKRNLLVQE